MIKIIRWGIIFCNLYLFANHCFCEIYCIFVKLVTMLAIYAIIAIVTYHAKHPINKTNEYFNNFSYRLILTKELRLLSGRSSFVFQYNHRYFFQTIIQFKKIGIYALLFENYYHNTPSLIHL